MLLDGPIVPNFLIFVKGNPLKMLLFTEVLAFWTNVLWLRDSENVHAQRILKLFHCLYILFVGVPLLIMTKTNQGFGNTRIRPIPKRLFIHFCQLKRGR
jgi:hypothetical protein